MGLTEMPERGCVRLKNKNKKQTKKQKKKGKAFSVLFE